LPKIELPTNINVAPGLELRLLRAEDAESLFALTESNRARLRVWLPWLDYVRTPADSAQFIAGAAARHAAGEELTLGLFSDRSLSGIVGTHAIDWTNCATTLGYWVGREAEGRGLTTAACSALLRVLFEGLELNRVGIHCATGNPRSQAVAKRLGFREEGIAREAERLYGLYVDHAVFSMLRREWERLNL
jgi:ribosomal-protein-serine acetyltransferase